MRRFRFAAITVLLLFNIPAPAQTVTGKLAGHVSDRAGAMAPGAQVP